jgi:uncharacterized phage protein (predicted DNA packaging)
MEMAELKEYLRVDSDDEDVLITGLQKAAEEYLTNAGVNIDYTKELYKLAVKVLVNHWYDNRMINTDKPVGNLSYSLSAMINQLKHTQVEVI